MLTLSLIAADGSVAAREAAVLMMGSRGMGGNALFDRYAGMKVLSLFAPLGDPSSIRAFASAMKDEIDIMKLQSGDLLSRKHYHIQPQRLIQPHLTSPHPITSRPSSA